MISLKALVLLSIWTCGVGCNSAGGNWGVRCVVITFSYMYAVISSGYKVSRNLEMYAE